MKIRGKKAQMQLSFGMIFSIILIIAFVAFAIYGVFFFLDMQKNAKIASFMENFNSDVEDMWKGSQGSDTVSYDLPKSIEKVCLITPRNEMDSNLLFIPEDEIEINQIKIEHLDIDKITSTSNNLRSQDPRGAFCVDVDDKGKVSMVIKKDFSETLVMVTRS